MSQTVQPWNWPTLQADQLPRVVSVLNDRMQGLHRALIPAQSMGLITLTQAVAGTVATDARTGETYAVTLSQNGTISKPTNSRPGKRLTYLVTQDGTGGWTLGWDSVFKFAVAWSDAGNTNGKVSSVQFVNDGTNYQQVGSQAVYH